MNPRYDDTALFEALDPEERDALRRALGADADAAGALALWRALRERLGADLRRDLPDFDLLVLYALGDEPAALAPEEEARLIAARPALEAALDAHPALHDVVRCVRADRAAFDDAWPADEPAPSHRPGLASVVGQRAVDRQAERPSRGRRWAWRSAVAVAVVAFMVLSVYLLQRDAGFETYETAAGETERIELADGSTVHLAAQSRLLVASGDTRLVRLTGEAVFDVIPGGARFVVETATARTTVLGTTFGVKASEFETDVVLASGAVALAPRANPDAAVRLEPGQRSRVVGGQDPEPPTRADITDALAWTGTWHFQATPLADIVERLAAHYGVAIEAAPGLAGDRVTGPFSSDVSVEETLRTLALALDARVEGDAAAGFRLVR